MNHHTNRLLWPGRMTPLAAVDPVTGNRYENAWGIQNEAKRWVGFASGAGVKDGFLESLPDGLYWVWHWHQGHFCCVGTYCVMGGNVTTLAVRRARKGRA